MSASRTLRICILSRNNLTRNTRIIRLAGALSAAGHEVTVLSTRRPLDELTSTTPGVEYHEVALDPWTRRYLTKRKRIYQRLSTKRRGAWNTTKRWAGIAWYGFWHALSLLPSALLLRPKGVPFFRFFKELARDPMKRVELYARPLSQAANTSSFAENAAEELEGKEFDFCQAHDTFALPAAERVAKASGGKIGYDAIEISEHRHVESPRRSPYERLVFRYQRRREARLIRAAAYSIAIGDGLADWHAERYGIARPTPVRNARAYWEYARRDDIRRDCALAEGDRLVTWIGSMDPDQGMETIIEAASLLPGNVHFALLGPVFPRFEPFIESMKQRVLDDGLETRVHFLPERTPLDLVPYVSGSDIGIIPRHPVSLNMVYCMPNKLMEMVMARLAVAATQELVEVRAVIERYDLGETFDVSVPADVARVVGDMLEPDNLARYREGAMRAAAELCWENEAHKYVELFDGSVSPGASKPDEVAVAS